jgi:hypothetical protein
VQEDTLPRYRNCARTACRLPLGSVLVAESVCAPAAGGVIVPISVHDGVFAFAV